MSEIENCNTSLISLKACGVCHKCLSNIAEIKKILKFYEYKINPLYRGYSDIEIFEQMEIDKLI